jgi:hypothetical protein
MIYPYTLKIKEPDLINMYLRLKQDRVAEIPKNRSKKISWDLKPIRPDIFLGEDRRYKRRYIALKPNLRFDIQPLNNKNTIYKLRFDKLF